MNFKGRVEFERKIRLDKEGRWVGKNVFGDIVLNKKYGVFFLVFL